MLPTLSGAKMMTSDKRSDRFIIERIKAALGTQEDGEILIELARQAHSAELKLAHYYRLRKCNGKILASTYALENGKY